MADTDPGTGEVRVILDGLEPGRTYNCYVKSVVLDPNDDPSDGVVAELASVTAPAIGAFNQFTTMGWDYDGDGDGLSLWDEQAGGTDPNNPDTDGDGLPDGAEVAMGTNPLVWDSDGDGLSDGDEVARGTNPLVGDTDGDGLSDGDEVIYYGTSAVGSDSDGDGLDDGFEVLVLSTDPANADSDADGIVDGVEVFVSGTDPLNGDTDWDGFSDAEDAEPLTAAAAAPPSDLNLIVDCEGWPEGVVPIPNTKTVTIPKGTARVIVRVVVFSREWPTYTGQPSVYNDDVTWQVSSPVPGGSLSRGWCVNELNNAFAEGVYPGGNYTDEILDLDYSAQTASGDSWLYLSGSAVNISDSALGSGVALLVTIGPRIELITPAGDPVNSPVATGDGQNEFVFDGANPGKLTIKLKAKVTPRGLAPEIAGRCYFTVGAIGNSMMEWALGNEGGQATAEGEYLSATVTFSGLPEHNWHFGTKFAAVYLDGERQDTERYEVFFPRDKNNHPGNDDKPESEKTPNWYYYWSQTSANELNGASLQHKYKAGGMDGYGRSYCNYEDGRWQAVIGGNIVTTQTEIRDRFGTAHFYKAGIDNFAFVVRHEEQHRSDFVEFWGATDRDDIRDKDHDYLLDSWEQATLSHPIWFATGPGRGQWVKYSPNFKLTFGVWDRWLYTRGFPGVGFSDAEDWALWRQDFPAENSNPYASEDWAQPGKQFGTQH
jgi:hypothetical protein